MSHRILVVEDNAANQLLAAAVLEREGFEVTVVDCAPEAKRAIAERRPDLVLMDIQLPEVDGLTFTRQLKADPATASIPIIAMSAHAMPADRDQALAAGCAAFISKPIDTRLFGDQVRTHLDHLQPAETAT